MANTNIMLGTDERGRPIRRDLAHMPPLVVAGHTGASMCINNIVHTLAQQNSPEEMRLLLIEEYDDVLAKYKNLPHLLQPLITDGKEAANALELAADEAESRFCRLNALGVNSIDDLPEKERPAHIFIIFHRFENMMEWHQESMTRSIMRISPLGYRTGMHLILSSHRQEDHIYTGLLKSFIPARISFRMETEYESRLILDRSGAENLKDYGEMIFYSPENDQYIRGTSAYAMDEAENDPHLLKIIFQLSNDSSIRMIEADDFFTEHAISVLEKKGILEKRPDNKWEVRRKKLNEHYPF